MCDVRKGRGNPSIIWHCEVAGDNQQQFPDEAPDLLSERGIIVSYEAIRYWCLKFGPGYARSIRKKRGRLGDIWHVDELFLKINGRQVYLWRAVDQDGDVLDILVTKRRDKRAAKRFFLKVFGTRQTSVAACHGQTQELCSGASGSLPFS